MKEEEADNITELQKDIEKQSERDSKFRKRHSECLSESAGVQKIIKESILGTVNKLLNDEIQIESAEETIKELGPNIDNMALANSFDDMVRTQADVQVEVDTSFDDIDDEEIDCYIMKEQEFQYKSSLWHKLNATYREEEKLTTERKRKPEKKRRRKPTTGLAASAGQAIEKILQEKKISSKINYDVLKSLNSTVSKQSEISEEDKEVKVLDTLKRRRENSNQSDVLLSQASMKRVKGRFNLSKKRGRHAKNQQPFGIPMIKNLKIKDEVKKETAEAQETVQGNDEEYDYEDESMSAEAHCEDNADEIGVLQMLQQYRDDRDEAEVIFGTGYEEEDY